MKKNLIIVFLLICQSAALAYDWAPLAASPDTWVDRSNFSVTYYRKRTYNGTFENMQELPKVIKEHLRGQKPFYEINSNMIVCNTGEVVNVNNIYQDKNGKNILQIIRGETPGFRIFEQNGASIYLELDMTKNALIPYKTVTLPEDTRKTYCYALLRALGGL